MICMNLIGTERFLDMGSKTKMETPGGARRRRRLPRKYICIAPDEAPELFDWLNSAGRHGEREVAEAHLGLCFHCQETVARMLRMDEEFRKKAGRCLHLSSSGNKPPMKTAHAAGAHGLNRTESHRQLEDGKSSRSMKAGGRS